jgi:hypothetical protein
MSLSRPSLLGYVLVFLGFVLGALGSVQVGLSCIAAGTASVSLASKAVGRVERYLPLALAVGLFALALALPRGR